MRGIARMRCQRNGEATQMARQISAARPERLTAREQLTQLAKDPRIAQRGTPEHDRIATGFFEHAERRARVPNVPIADDRNVELTLDQRDDAPICRAEVVIH